MVMPCPCAWCSATCFHRRASGRDVGRVPSYHHSPTAGIGKVKATAADAPAELLAASSSKTNESTFEYLVLEIVILHSAHLPSESGKVL